MTSKVVDRAIQAHGGMGFVKIISAGFGSMAVPLELPMGQTKYICINWVEI